MPGDHGSHTCSLGWSQRLPAPLKRLSLREPCPAAKSRQKRLPAHLDTIPGEGNSWLTWLVLSSSCGKSGIRRQVWSSVSTRRSPRSTAVHTGKGRGTAGTCRQQQGRGSRLPREHDGQRCGGMAGRSKTSSACRKRKRCQPPPGRRLPQPNERDGRR